VRVKPANKLLTYLSYNITKIGKISTKMYKKLTFKILRRSDLSGKNIVMFKERYN
jgi:hypothetical protein